MATVAYLDTHVVAWLYAFGASALSPSAAETLRSVGELRVSPMVRLELRYLHEIGRLSEPPAPALDELGARLGLFLCRAPFASVVLEAEKQTWTRDPFDRLIVAQAAVHDALLVTKDEAIRANYARAQW